MIEEKLYAATWCPVCDKRVSLEGRDTCKLLAHIRKYHPEIASKCLDNQRDEESRVSANRISSSETSVQPVSSGSKRNEPKKVYATRVDTWKLHGEKKVCPQCRREAIPTLHTRGDKLTTSHIGALCFLGSLAHNAVSRPVWCGIARAHHAPRINLCFQKARFRKSQRAECERCQTSQSGALLPWVPALRAQVDKARAPKQPNPRVLFAKVKTWKYHEKSVRCPACGVEDVPISLTEQQKFTSSRFAALCLLGCWPLCFIPLTMSGDKSARTLCPHCGYDYGGLCSAVDERSSAPECASSRGKFGNFATVRSRGGCTRRVQPSYREDRQSHGSSCDECSSDGSRASGGRDRRRDSSESESTSGAPEAP